MSDNPKRHLYLLAKGFYQAPTYADGLRIVCAYILGKPNPSIEECFGLLLPVVWKCLQLFGEDKVAGEKDLNPGTLTGGSIYEFADLFMFMRKMVFNLEKNPAIVTIDALNDKIYTHWDELFAESFLNVLSHRIFEEGELGKPDPEIMPINAEERKRR